MIIQDIQIFTWLFSFLFLLPVIPAWASAVHLFMLILLWVGAGRVFTRSPGDTCQHSRWPKSLILAAAMTLPLHLLAWQWPIPSLGDDHLYVGVPAAVAYRMPLGLWSAPLLIALVALWQVVRRLSARWLGLTLTVLGILFLAALHAHIPFFNLNNSAIWIYRYPPLMTLVNAVGFEIFGFQDWIPSVIQFIFLVFAARVAGFWLDDGASRLGTYLAFLWAPSFFHFSNLSAPTCGLLFFILAAVHHYFSYLRDRRACDRTMLLAVSLCGAFYYQLFLFVIVFMMADITLRALLRHQNWSSWRSVMPALLLPAFAIAPFVFCSGYFLQLRDAGIHPSMLINDPARLFENARTFVSVYGLAMSALLLAGLGTLVWVRRDERIFWGIFLLGLHLLLSSSGAAGMLRHAQPLYLPFTIGLMMILSRLGDGVVGRVARGVLVVAFLAGAFLSDSPQMRTLANWDHNTFQPTLPYEEVIVDLAGKAGNSAMTVYAPMGTEPSHFYLFKTGAWGKLNWVRKPLMDHAVTEAELARILADCGARYFVLPITLAKNDFMDPGILEMAARAPFLHLYQRYTIGEDSLLIYEVQRNRAR